jgi:hypothetical protein
MGDKAYSFAANRAYLRKRGITAVIPVKEDQKSTAGPAAARAVGHPPSTGNATRSATPPGAASASSSSSARSRYDKREFMYQGTVDLAWIRISLRDPVP